MQVKTLYPSHLSLCPQTPPPPILNRDNILFRWLWEQDPSPSPNFCILIEFHDSFMVDFLSRLARENPVSDWLTEAGISPSDTQRWESFKLPSSKFPSKQADKTIMISGSPWRGCGRQFWLEQAHVLTLTAKKLMGRFTSRRWAQDKLVPWWSCS